MIFTGDVVLYKSKPYVFLELDVDNNINALISIQYTEKGWVYHVESKEDILTDIDPYDCRVLRVAGCTLDDLCTEIGKYYEKHAILKGYAFNVKTIQEDLSNLEVEMFTCDVNNLIKVRKKWRTTEVELNKAVAKYEKEEKALDTKVKSISKQYDGELLITTQQVPTDFDNGATVESEDKDYILILPTKPTTRGYLYDTETHEVIPAEKGTFFDSENVLTISDELKKELVGYVDALDYYLAVKTQIDVYNKILDTNATAVKTQKDKEIKTYRQIYDEVSKKLELEKETLKNAEKSVEEKKGTLDTYGEW